jgi:Uma2 family endonuclease
MSIAKDLDPTQLPSDLAWSASVWDNIENLPSNLCSDEPPLETDLHLRQIILLIQSLESLWRDRQDFYATGNLTIYYSPEQIKARDFRGPDFFVVLNTERKLRKSWVVWAEGGKFPNVIVEILSDSTAKIDRSLKKQLYQDIFHTPEYFWFDPVTLEFQGFTLMQGQYQPVQPNAQGYLWSQQLELYLGIRQAQLRFFTAEGQLVQVPEEIAIQEQQRADQEQQRADRLAEKLRELGIEPSDIE